MKVAIDPTTFITAVSRQRDREPVIVPHVIGGRDVFEGEPFLREDPVHPDRYVSGAHEAPAKVVQHPVDASRAAQREWERVPATERAARLRAGMEYVEKNGLDFGLHARLR
jgi:1-pyrroline-5-carboxylate dehydrogenase